MQLFSDLPNMVVGWSISLLLIHDYLVHNDTKIGDLPLSSDELYWVGSQR